MSAFVGSWKLVEMTNFKALLDKVYVDERIRQAIMNHRPKVTYRLIGNDGMEIKTESEMGANVMTFKYGVEFTQDTGFLSTPKAYVTVESDKKLVHIQRHGFSKTVITREVYDDILITTIKNQNQTATIKYQRV